MFLVILIQSTVSLQKSKYSVRVVVMSKNNSVLPWWNPNYNGLQFSKFVRLFHVRLILTQYMLSLIKPQTKHNRCFSFISIHLNISISRHMHRNYRQEAKLAGTKFNAHANYIFREGNKRKWFSGSKTRFKGLGQLKFSSEGN